MCFQKQILLFACLLLLINYGICQCSNGLTMVTVYSGQISTQVCIIPSSIVKHCIMYSSPTLPQKFSTLSQLKCTRCEVNSNQQFIIGLTSNTFSPSYYLSCIPKTQKVVNCEYYIQQFDPITRYTQFICGQCPIKYPTIVKGNLNEYWFCVDRVVENCAIYREMGVDRTGYAKIKCESCEKYALDLVNNLCLKIVENCVTYDSQRKCTKCQSGFTLANEICSKVVNTISSLSFTAPIYSVNISNPCLQSSRRDPKICSKCQQNFTLSSGQCISCPQGSYINSRGQCINGAFPNCGTFNSQGVCLFCKQNYQFNNQLTACISKIKTIKCPENTKRFNYFSLSGVCVPVDINCQENSFGINGCFECKPGFYNWEGICYLYR